MQLFLPVLIFHMIHFRYGGSVIKDGTLAELCAQADMSQQFMDLCSWLCSEIKDYCDFKETVAGMHIHFLTTRVAPNVEMSFE